MTKKEYHAENAGLFGEQTMEQEISLKSKKNEILDAYHALLNKIQDNKQVSHQESKKKQEEVALVSKVSDFSVDRIIANIAEVKKSIGQGLEQLEQKLTGEYRRFSELQEAINLESKHLEEFHQINKNVDTLTALLQAQKEYRVKFEQEIQQEKQQLEEEIETQRATWEKEQEEAELERKEREARTKKERTREEEEYRYATMQERRRDEDAYAAKRALLEKDLTEKKARVELELNEREKNVAASEAQLKELSVQVAAFPRELEQAVEQAEERVRTELNREHQYTLDISEKEVEGERKLSAQLVASLQAKIKEQDAFIRTLTQKTDEAGSQVQTIALKALESSSYMRFHGATSDDNKKSNLASSG